MGIVNVIAGIVHKHAGIVHLHVQVLYIYVQVLYMYMQVLYMYVKILYLYVKVLYLCMHHVLCTRAMCKYVKVLQMVVHVHSTDYTSNVQVPLQIAVAKTLVQYVPALKSCSRFIRSPPS